MRKQISGAVRHLGWKNDVNGYMELRKNKEKVALLITTTPLSEDGKRMNHYDMINDFGVYKNGGGDYTNQFELLFTHDDLLRLKDIIDKKVKGLKIDASQDGGETTNGN